jgi:hypothetical protein
LLRAVVLLFAIKEGILKKGSSIEYRPFNVPSVFLGFSD